MTVDDAFFGPAIIDRDERRDDPVPHRYVHGSFSGTATRFSCYLPDADVYRGRFLQMLQGGTGGSEYQGLVSGGLALAASCGAYLIESNQGHVGNDLSGLKGDPTILEWRASAATARFASTVAAEHYGDPPVHGYVYGGSGGAMRAVNCIESAPDLYDGAVPFMINRNGLSTYNWSVTAWALLTLGDRVGAVIDATAPGGSGDPFSVLPSVAQRDALASLYRAWFCRGAEPQIVENPLWILGMQLLAATDRTYYSDFWTVSGYEGADRDPVVTGHLITMETTVRKLVRVEDVAPGGGLDDINAGAITGGGIRPGTVVGIVVDGDPARLLGSAMTFLDGGAAGRRVYCTGNIGDAAVAILDAVGFRDVAVGDRLAVDNRDFLAFAAYHRHAVDARYPSMRHLLVDGRPIHQQRPIDFDRLRVPAGHLDGKLILLQHTSDRECFPSCALPYIEDLRANLGSSFDEKVRLWWIENAAHLVPLSSAGRTSLINYGGAYSQAVVDVIRWVEEGTAPPASTRFEVSLDGALTLSDTADQRLGIQPVVTATADSGARAEVAVGQTVQFRGTAEVPPGAGRIVRAEWDFEGTGRWPERESPLDAPTVSSETRHRYDTAGTYFASFRVTAQRDGDPADRIRPITNLARVRVVVR